MLDPMDSWPPGSSKWAKGSNSSRLSGGSSETRSSKTKSRPIKDKRSSALSLLALFAGAPSARIEAKSITEIDPRHRRGKRSEYASSSERTRREYSFTRDHKHRSHSDDSSDSDDTHGYYRQHPRKSRYPKNIATSKADQMGGQFQFPLRHENGMARPAHVDTPRHDSWARGEAPGTRQYQARYAGGDAVPETQAYGQHEFSHYR